MVGSYLVMIRPNFLQAVIIVLFAIYAGTLVLSSGAPRLVLKDGKAILMADIPKKRLRGLPSVSEPTKPPMPGSSEMRRTYKIPRLEIIESNVGVTQPIDDNWCEEFHLKAVPVGCTCWRYEYLAYFCVDWSCSNGHSSEFAMCQFLNVSWPLDPPRRRGPDVALANEVKGLLKKLKAYFMMGSDPNPRRVSV